MVTAYGLQLFKREIHSTKNSEAVLTLKMLPTATRAVAFLSFPSVKVKGNVYLFVLLGASLVIFCCDVFLLRSTTTPQTQSDLRRSLYAQPITHPTTKRQKHIGSSSKVDRKKHSRRLERSSSHGSKQQTMPPSAGAFVHIGKTGGSTISKLLRNGCHAVYPKPCRNITDETIVSKLVDYYHVPDFWKLPTSNHKFYIVSVRDPYDRTVSAFVYGHPKNVRARGEEKNLPNVTILGGRVAYRCFPTLEKWVEFLGDDSHQFEYSDAHDYLDSRNCTSLARASIHSRVRFYSHLYFNIESVASKIPESTKPTIYVIRQKQVWKDWKEINRLLGHKGKIAVPKESNLRNVATFRQPVKRKLSDQGRDRLCRALQGEYKTYVRLLRKAINVKDVDIADALSYSRSRCPNIQIG